MRILYCIFLFLTSLAGGLPAYATASDCQFDSRWLSTPCEHLMRTYREGAWDLYLSGYAYHGADGYTKEQRNRLNAYTFGGGVGKRRRDSASSEDLIYAMAF